MYGMEPVFIAEKGKDPTQSHDKNPYTNKNVKRANWRHQNGRLHRDCGPI